MEHPSHGGTHGAAGALGTPWGHPAPCPGVTACLCPGQLWSSQFAERRVKELLWFLGTELVEQTVLQWGEGDPTKTPKLDKENKKEKKLVFLHRFDCQIGEKNKKQINKSHEEGRKKKKINISQLLLISGRVFTQVNILPAHTASPAQAHQLCTANKLSAGRNKTI